MYHVRPILLISQDDCTQWAGPQRKKINVAVSWLTVLLYSPNSVKILALTSKVDRMAPWDTTATLVLA